MELKEIKDNYLSESKKVTDLSNKILVKERQIYRLQNRKDKARENSWWGDLLIRPIIENLKVKFPNITWDDERLVPLGMRNATSVFGKTENDVTVGFTFTPTHLSEGIISFDNGTYLYGERNYIADPNGFHNNTEKVESMEQLYNHVIKTIKSESQLAQ